KNKELYVPGFSASTVAAEIKKGKIRPDLGLIVSETPAVVSGVFTRNLVKAAPLQINLERIRQHCGRALLVNSGNANACTGAQGLKDAHILSKALARQLDIPDDQIFLASTGVIGQRLPITRMRTALPSLTSALSADHLPSVAQAIMTTDTFEKIQSRKIRIGGKTVRMVGMAKGAGMIHPDMATMLCFVMTDLAIAPVLLDELLLRATESSFNSITIDGDTSTNDMILVMANGLAGNARLENPRSPGTRIFRRALENLLSELSRMIVRDGEGATKEVLIQIDRAKSTTEAKTLAKTIATSPLVKTALFGQDANWGRILAAMGRSGVAFDPEKVDIFFDKIHVVKKGISTGPAKEAQAARVLRKREFTIRIDMHQGTDQTRVFTCDLSLDYVRINADYRT
ncbi:MAG TPA: bifunctional glutamate N-acetyltransferase/amino-acid acetyltransferase ArgJ, partial [Thermodesulfobacteriota bacterium]|nr:bifunctional glutamate N-acetyltransferase/amino-acid acetyltransferase ArgJ [Thermodesulfobacteriota bacterium]